MSVTAFHSFSDEDIEDRSQVTEQLEKIEKLVEENGGHHYTDETIPGSSEKNTQ